MAPPSRHRCHPTPPPHVSLCHLGTPVLTPRTVSRSTPHGWRCPRGPTLTPPCRLTDRRLERSRPLRPCPAPSIVAAFLGNALGPRGWAEALRADAASEKPVPARAGAGRGPRLSWVAGVRGPRPPPPGRRWCALLPRLPTLHSAPCSDDGTCPALSPGHLAKSLGLSRRGENSRERTGLASERGDAAGWPAGNGGGQRTREGDSELGTFLPTPALRPVCVCLCPVVALPAVPPWKRKPRDHPRRPPARH